MLFFEAFDAVAHSFTGDAGAGGLFFACRGDAGSVFRFSGATDELVELLILSTQI